MKRRTPTVSTFTRRHLFGASASVIAASLSRSAHAATPALVEAAKKEGKVVVYGDFSMVPFLVEGFTKQYPYIQATTVTGGSWNTYNRFLVEKSAGRTLADVLMGADDSMLTADKAGHLVDCGLEPSTDIPASAIAPDRHYVLPQGIVTPLIYNSDAAGKRSLPKDWTDIARLGDEWNGLVIMSDPRNSGTALGMLTTIYQTVRTRASRRHRRGAETARHRDCPEYRCAGGQGHVGRAAADGLLAPGLFQADA